MNAQITIENLSKRFGQKQALSHVNLTLHNGMFGLLGRNGAGKTTLMRILATLLNKTEGKVTVCGIPVEQAAKVRDLVGYLPQDFDFYPNMTVYQAMDYLGVLSDVPKKIRRERIPTLLAQVNLDDCRNLRVRTLSGGMRRRLGIAQAILHDPQVLIVDEPTAGLDPEGRVRFRGLLCDIAKDRIVLLSTHIVEDIEKTCKNIAILNEGRLIYNGTLADYIGEEEGLEAAYMKKMGGLH